MKKKWLVWGGVILVVLFFFFSIRNSYNSMVEMDEGVTANWQQVENVYQRRMDLIPNLVNTVQGYADFEKSTLTQVVEARAKATAIHVDPSKLDAASLQKFQSAQGELSGALSRLMVVSEQYPNLKANESFIALQAELEGTENRIANERRKFNDAAQQFNTYIRRFPKNIYAGLFGFERRAYFEAAEGADKAPTVKFNTK